LLAGDVKLDPVRFQVASGSISPAVEAASSSLAITSTPVGPDIDLDQSFVGNTPLTVKVPLAGTQYQFESPGFQDWVRDMNLSGGTITLNAELVAGSNVTSPHAGTAAHSPFTGS